jgi:hypothetical protein
VVQSQQLAAPLYVLLKAPGKRIEEGLISKFD